MSRDECVPVDKVWLLRYNSLNLPVPKREYLKAFSTRQEEQDLAIRNHGKYRSLLEGELKHLRGDLEQLETSGQPAEDRREGSPFGKREEEATESFELEKRLALENQIRAKLGEIEHALSKFEKGTYGLCDICGKTINPERLEALPQAKLCMSCKAKHPGV